MGRPLRTAPGELVYHVLNRANGRQPIFDKDGDYAAFERGEWGQPEVAPISWMHVYETRCSSITGQQEFGRCGGVG